MASDRDTLILAGGPALSDFRAERLRENLGGAGVAADRIEARHFYVARFAATPHESVLARLRALLGLGGDEPPADTGIAVVPRLGTLSPWSSKAEDIARACGLEGLLRLERGVLYRIEGVAPGSEDARLAAPALHDPMTESVLDAPGEAVHLFDAPAPRPLRRVPLARGGREALAAANRDWGLALSDEEIDYLGENYARLGRDPTDAELMMFAQINSEHCRHKIFNADWTVDGEAQPHSLFEMIKASHAASPDGVLSAYSDNAAVVAGPRAARFFTGPDRVYRAVEEPVHLLMKVETHNHPTAIAPDPGAATGAGGEIRDEAATGRGGRPKAGLCGFSVSNLRIPGFVQPWEVDHGRPARQATPLQIMLEGPIGAAAYNNEFGRPNLAGYFRSFELDSAHAGLRGYHKPIMIAGGMGNIRDGHVTKDAVAVDARLIVLGGPAMLIGLGGGAASSMASGAASEALDFASVQRANPEIERRCQEVIDACWALGEDNPIASIHDVGAGGLSNALPEIIDADDRGAQVRLRDIHSADPGLSPMEIWCNESQERYVLAVPAVHVEAFAAICARERCPYAEVGFATAEPRLCLSDADSGEDAVDMPMPVLLGKTPRMHREGRRDTRPPPVWERAGVTVEEAARRVLRLPAVAGKGFLITIGDRSVGGLVVRDQMVGPWQVPVADVAVTATGFTATTGEAMAMGERTPVALLDAPASGRLAVGETLTNIAAARVADLSDVRLSANWMAACGDEAEDARLYDTVRAVGAELCVELGIAIPVGKDSLSMRSRWTGSDGDEREMRAPLSLIVSAFAPVADAAATLTPQLRTDRGETELLLIDLGCGRNRLGGSALAQVHGELGGAPPDVDDPAALKAFFGAIQSLAGAGRLLAYHDRSDGGLFATVCEMAFAGRAGVELELSALGEDVAAALFSEELGAVVQVTAADAAALQDELRAAGLHAHRLGPVTAGRELCFTHRGATVFAAPRTDLHRAWAETSYHLQALRDEPGCAAQEYDNLRDADDPGLPAAPSFDFREDVAAPYLNLARPRVAILREQGVNGHVEMAWAFTAAGFEAVDVHMSELLSGEVALSGFQGLAACGGFSYGDVLGAGQGWAKSILFHEAARHDVADFFARSDTFALGVCNGCQMLSALRELIPGTDDWPAFVRNVSEQFEARTSAVEIGDSRSVLLDGMAGSRLPIAVAHGEGRVAYREEGAADRLAAAGQVAVRYVDHYGRATERYPYNPNGSPGGVTGLCNADGRVLILMPHPERVVRSMSLSWHPDDWTGASPWMRLFGNARRFVG
ncbi:phosphoribosylformylglycinamidine synthase [Salinisphaera sp. PC39]|uniref:phosphoribosylformylglycinamidine synthase n=1 Tax=Salinisphaera sp. PC39 TaxID=1304156 RepID=UPI00333FED93